MESGLLQEALALLRRAGRMDLLNQDGLNALRLARRAAQGVAAAVLACSPPLSPGYVRKVSSPGWAAGRAAGRGCGQAKCNLGSAAFKAAGFGRRIGASPHTQKGGVRTARSHGAKKKGRGSLTLRV
ncbi:hypothetical protein NDU88_004409 [Pleurodeles waltl]|uniref:Uncharacterized protein n=1 Tax=Pleurodeles waltl TaxID=8319 RepID=A0AAV7PF38_PLEWA|nr:hypothetical protein NDU88_004409 [Pleurodeles waltl]